MNRLQSSFCSLINSSRNTCVDDSKQPVNLAEKEELRKAVMQSEKIIDALLTEVESTLTLECNNSQWSQEKDDTCELVQTVMLTLFWTPRVCTNKSDTTIIVRGHACFGARHDPLKYKPDPITAAIALTPQHGSNHSLSFFRDLPNRYMNQPDAKLSSWCRDRRPLERNSLFKPTGVGEVLLAKPLDDAADDDDGTKYDEFQLLEGLTSNLFVVYRDGTIRTASENLVLGGYVRHLILSLASSLGLKVDTENPIKVQDAKNGLWVEAFVTSSIRIVVPVGQILIPSDNDKSSRKEKEQQEVSKNISLDTLWSKDTVKDVPYGKPHWKTLYNEIMTNPAI
uniref:Uncharacterized protein n=1 Tax=Ditylum brightwellii TaxID=49249 RepID=A0A7S4UF75_9STRA